MGHSGQVELGFGGIGGNSAPPKAGGGTTGGCAATASASRCRLFTVTGDFADACDAADVAVGTEEPGISTAGVASSCWMSAEEGAWSAGVAGTTGRGPTGGDSCPSALARGPSLFVNGATAAEVVDTAPISAK